MKGVVLAGGLGTRLYPLTKITNKHLLPVYDQPMIYYPIQQLVNAGIREIMLVTGGSYAGHFLNLLENGGDFGLRRLHYAFQRGEGGIADALKLAEDFVDGERCVVILGDNIFENPIAPAVEKFRQQEAGARILLKEVPDPHRFGVAELRDGKVVGIEEKPIHPKSNYAVTGVYMYDAYVWEVVKTLKPSRRNELEITDVNNAYIARGALTYDIVEGWWTDAGTFESLLRANMLVAAQRQSSSAKV
ncbi:MAG: sugar phosphate nucleotidyltransferase [Candidatus Sumerlaeaceae bacterium]|nr:sugar phosphate nucleotidyltransferase [Candidatus Sumerlaeaceae bacterium]